eukprot:s958_g2.t1
MAHALMWTLAGSLRHEKQSAVNVRAPFDHRLIGCLEKDGRHMDAAMMDGATAQLAATPKSGGLAHFAAGFAEGSAAEMEEDAKEDARKQLSVQACFQAPDTTLNVMVGTTGNILMTLNEGGLHYFYAGARANVGIRAGRYMFEVRVIELLNQTETGRCQRRFGLQSAKVASC